MSYVGTSVFDIIMNQIMNSPIEEVYKSSLKFLMPLNLEQTYKTIVNEAIKLVGATHGSILLAKKGKIIRTYASNPEVFKIVPRQHGYTYRVYKTQKTVVLPKIKIARFHPEVSVIKMRADIMTPLIYKDKSIGVLSLYTNRRQKFTQKDKEMLQTFSPLASLVIRKAQLHEDLEKAIETRDLFLSLASHELKTPITTIYVYLQLIQRNLEKNKKFDPEWIATLLKEMVRLTKIVDDLLEVSRIRTGKIQYTFEDCDIEEVVRRALLTFRVNHPHNIIFENNIAENRKNIIADFDKLMSVVLNILDNSAKHSSGDLPITLSLSEKNDRVDITVKDQGKGIPKDEIEEVFKGFYKVEHNTQPGMGLGLFLAKEVIESHKGKIKISSSQGKGTIVRISLPKKLGSK